MRSRRRGLSRSGPGVIDVSLDLETVVVLTTDGLEIDPRVLLGFEDAVIAGDGLDDPPDEFHLPLSFTWALPPLPHAPDLLVLATDLAAVGGPDLPLEVSAIDSYPSVTDAPETSLRVVGHQRVSLLRIRDGEEVPCETLDRCLNVSRYLLEKAPGWIG